MSMVPFSRPRRNSTDKPLPHNPDAERSILGAILLENATLQVVSEVLKPDDFYFESHRRIFRCMLFLAAKQQMIDLITLAEQLHQNEQLESVGGAAYVSSLLDGIAKVSNVEHHAKIVKEKSRLRDLINLTEDVQLRAWEGLTTPDDLHNQLELYKKQLQQKKSSLVMVDIRDFLTMNVEPVDFVLEPLLPLRGTGMIYSPRGVGKTFVLLHMAYCVAAGNPECFVWPVPKARRTIYIDGEMDAATLQERYEVIAKINAMRFPERGQLNIITPDLQQEAIPHINTRTGQLQIEEKLVGGEFLILDNLSALSPSSDEKETEDWAILQDWFLHLRRKGVSVLFAHHSGKAGDQRGTSKREDLLNFILKLHVPSDHDLDRGLRAEMRLTKLRARCTNPTFAQPFDLTLNSDENGNTIWLQKPLHNLLRQRASQMLTDGMKEHDVVQETGLSRWSVRRINKKRLAGETFSPSEN